MRQTDLSRSQDSGTAEPPVVDPSALDALRAATPPGSNLVERVVGTWLRDTPARLAEARLAVERGDREVAHRAVHSLKSSSATVGAVRLAERCRAVENVFKRGCLLPELLDEIDRECAEAAKVLESVRESAVFSG